MSYQGQDPYQGQGQSPNSGQYSGYTGYTPPPNDPYSGQPGQQQPGYGQPNEQQYGQPQPQYGQPQYGAAAGGVSTLGNLPQNTAAGLSYLFVWVGGLVFFLTEKNNRFVRFHAMQSIIFFGGLSIIGAVVSFLPFGLSYLSWVVDVVQFVGWIVLMINAFQGNYYKLPFVGDYAEKYAYQGMQP